MDGGVREVEDRGEQNQVVANTKLGERIDRTRLHASAAAMGAYMSRSSVPCRKARSRGTRPTPSAPRLSAHAPLSQGLEPRKRDGCGVSVSLSHRPVPRPKSRRH